MSKVKKSFVRPEAAERYFKALHKKQPVRFEKNSFNPEAFGLNKEDLNPLIIKKFKATYPKVEKIIKAKISNRPNNKKIKTQAKEVHMAKSTNSTERKNYKEFFLNQLSSPKSREDLAKAFQKKWPKNTAKMTADEKAEREVNRNLYFIRKAGCISDKADKGSKRNKKLFFMTNAQKKTYMDATARKAPAPRKASAAKKSKPAAKKSSKPVSRKAGKKFI